MRNHTDPIDNSNRLCSDTNSNAAGTAGRVPAIHPVCVHRQGMYSATVIFCLPLFGVDSIPSITQVMLQDARVFEMMTLAQDLGVDELQMLCYVRF